MNVLLILNIIGVVLVITSAFMLVPAAVSALNGTADLFALLMSFAVTFSVGLIFYLLTRGNEDRELRQRDGFLIVTLSWLLVSFFGSLPYLFSGTFDSFTDAYFEAMAGFTTTGSSVIDDLGTVERGILFWRSLTQWIGGMGIILFTLAVLPLLGSGGMQLFKAEVPELVVDRLRPKIIDTAKSLWTIYVVLTFLAGVLYAAGGMGFFDAANHALTTLATGGFSTRNASMAYFDSAFIQYVAVVFMFLAGVNYTLYFNMLSGRPARMFKSSEFRFYLSVVLVAITIITIYNRVFTYGSLAEAFRYSSFQTVSMVTTTGYSTADYELWAPLTQVLLVTLMFYGGMIGSTGGGMKQVRVMLMFKQIYRELFHLIHPRAVSFIKLDAKELSKELLGSVWGFLFLFILLWVTATLALSALGLDIVTAASSAASAISNVGPALGATGPTDNYASMPMLGKWVLIFCMLAGRLEVYTVVVLLVPRFWKK